MTRRFRLERVLQFRLEEERRQDLRAREAGAAAQEAERALRALEAQRDQELARRLPLPLATAPGREDAQRSTQYRDSLIAAIREGQRRQEDLAAVASEEARELLHRRQARRALEILRQRHLDREDAALRREEALLTDEIATRQTARRLRAGSKGGRA